MRFRELYVDWIRDLVNSQMFGNSSTAVAEGMLSSWFLQGKPNLEHLGINFDDAKSKRYIPCEFEEISESRYCNVHQEQPLEIQVCGQLAYCIDELASLGVYGNSRTEVVKRGVEDYIMDNLDRLSIVAGIRPLRK